MNLSGGKLVTSFGWDITIKRANITLEASKIELKVTVDGGELAYVKAALIS
ncbi:hypothetical protein WME89_52680 [Sorangium sp. So ce321]|uniref:hypothetical protein n=1 Tax=Sorangium sp. So ce321 TaxID=3133300 RepID=UPI003F63FA1C